MLAEGGVTPRGLRVSIDTRTLGPGDAFVALRGERFDAHDFLPQALASGAGLVLVHDEAAWLRVEPKPAHVGAVLVENTLDALATLARAHRTTLARAGTRVLAVAGSNGKTSTVRLLDAALGASLRGSASQKSFNNSVGVPLTLLAARPGDDYVVCEAGTNAPGELAHLARIIEPDVVVLTSLGREHLEGLGDLAGVAAEEASILAGLRPGGLAFVGDEPLLVDAARKRLAQHGHGPGALRVVGAREGSDVRVEQIVQSFERGLSFGIVERAGGRAGFALPMLGAHNAGNAALAIAVARALGVGDVALAQGLARVAAAPMRLERRTTPQGVRVLNDAYNANPESMLAAIATTEALLASDAGVFQRRLLVLGDMLELGPQAPALHAEVLSAAQASAARTTVPTIIVAVGPLMQAAAARDTTGSGPARVVAAPTRDAASALLGAGPAKLRSGDLVLLKGSRGMGLEKLMATLAGA